MSRQTSRIARAVFAGTLTSALALLAACSNPAADSGDPTPDEPRAARLALVRGWESRGHELGPHVHGPSLGQWNGYTNQASFRDDPEYLGTMDEMMDVVSAVPAAGRVRTAAVTDADSDQDYPAGILYDVDGGAAGVGDLVSSPAPVVWNGHTMTGLRHARYGSTPSPVNVDLAQLRSALGTVGEGQVIGLVFHCFEFDEAPDLYRNLFAALAAEGVTARTVERILSG